ELRIGVRATPVDQLIREAAGATAVAGIVLEIIQIENAGARLDRRPVPDLGRDTGNLMFNDAAQAADERIVTADAGQDDDVRWLAAFDDTRCGAAGCAQQQENDKDT